LAVKEMLVPYEEQEKCNFHSKVADVLRKILGEVED